MSITYGLNKKLFAQLVNSALNESGKSNREIAKELEISCSTLTRIQKLEPISAESFVKILKWIKINSTHDFDKEYPLFDI